MWIIALALMAIAIEYITPPEPPPKSFPVGDRYARALIAKSLTRELGREPCPAELQAIQAVARYESEYGKGWKDAGIGSNNWGAIVSPTCDPEWSFSYGDSSPARGKYTACFVRYDTPMAGAAALVRTIVRRDSVMVNLCSLPHLEQFAASLYVTNYYAGAGATGDERIARYNSALVRHVRRISFELDEPIAFIDVTPGGLARGQ